jgi:hypothetical protein
MDCNITFRGIGQSGDPIVEITKIINPLPSDWEH